MYKLTQNLKFVIRTSDGGVFDATDISCPETPRYLAWKEEGNTPLPADTTPLAELLHKAKEELRSLRKPALDAVNGIGWRAMMSGDTELANEALQISLALLDITDDPALNAATTYQEMKVASVIAYKKIASNVSPALHIVFRETLGG